MEYLGRVYTATGKFAEAEQVLSAITTEDEKYYGYWGCPFQALGELYSRMVVSDQRRKVLENYLKSAQIENERGWTQYRAAQECYNYGDYPEALKYIDKAMGVESSAENVNEYRILKGYILTGMRDYAQAKRLFKEAARRGKGAQADRARTGLGHIAITVHDYAAADRYFSRMLETDPADIMANLGKAWILANRGDHAGSLAYYEKVLAARPLHLLALLGKGNAYMGLKQLDRADEMFNTVLTLDPGNEYALANLGISAFNRRDEEKARQYLQDAMKAKNSNFVCPYEGMGLLHLHKGELKEAERDFKKAIEINPDIDYKKYNGLAKIYLQQGKVAEARLLLRKSVQNYPYDPEAKEMLERLPEK
jgi:tetratricopeptide (TPR) repeat protein